MRQAVRHRQETTPETRYVELDKRQRLRMNLDKRQDIGRKRQRNSPTVRPAQAVQHSLHCAIDERRYRP